MQFDANDYRDENGNVPDQNKLDYTVALVEVMKLEKASPESFGLIQSVSNQMQSGADYDVIRLALEKSFSGLSDDALDAYEWYYTQLEKALKNLSDCDGATLVTTTDYLSCVVVAATIKTMY